jgi:predicted DCC family thiol-disulfide oxidoreductase YuxK
MRPSPGIPRDPAEIQAPLDAPAFIILYDGECGLCSRAVVWLIAHDPGRRLVFAPLQGETARRIRVTRPEIPVGMDTVVFVEPSGVHLRSKAFLHVSRHLGAPWRLAYHLRWLPAFPLDLLYGFVARVRYRIWGRHDSCRLPGGGERGRFLP